MAAIQTSKLLKLPQEIRDHIIGEVFFPGEKEPNDLTQNIRGLASTAVRQIHPYNTDKDKKPHFEIAILMTCKQLQHDAEAILYGSSSWNLMYQDWWDNEKVSYEFFERFPRRLRRLIQRVERKCYSRPYAATIFLWDWIAFMTFLARECPSLHSLKLWGPGDRNEGPPWVQTCKKDEEWVQAILQIRSLKCFDIPVITNGNIYDYPEFRDEFLPWLKTSLVGAKRPLFGDCQDEEQADDKPPFHFLGLPREIRDQIYRYALLPPSRRLHPYIKPWYDMTTRNALPLFLSCRQIHNEAELILYGEGIFTSPCLPKYDRKLSRFLGGKIREPGSGLNDRLLKLIKNLSFGWSKVGQYRVFNIIGKSMQLDYLEFVLPEHGVDYINEEWRHRSINPKALWRAGYAGDFTMQTYARIPNLVIRTPPGKDLEPDCREWWTRGLRKEVRTPSGDPKLAWLHKKADRMLSGYSSVQADAGQSEEEMIAVGEGAEESSEVDEPILDSSDEYDGVSRSRSIISLLPRGISFLEHCFIA